MSAALGQCHACLRGRPGLERSECPETRCWAHVARGTRSCSFLQLSAAVLYSTARVATGAQQQLPWQCILCGCALASPGPLSYAVCLPASERQSPPRRQRQTRPASHRLRPQPHPAGHQAQRAAAWSPASTVLHCLPRQLAAPLQLSGTVFQAAWTRSAAPHLHLAGDRRRVPHSAAPRMSTGASGTGASQLRGRGWLPPQLQGAFHRICQFPGHQVRLPQACTPRSGSAPGWLAACCG